MTLRQTSKSFASRRMALTQTPFSTTSIMSKHTIKQEVNISDIYSEVKQKITEMESAFKSQNLSRQRQMLKTYLKILDRIGQEVLQAKQKYRNLNKQNLKTDKRLQIVTELNQQRAQCHILTDRIKQVREQIKNFQDQNHYLEQQVEALQKIQGCKRRQSKSQKTKYRLAKQYHSQSLQKNSLNQKNQNLFSNHPIFSSNENQKTFGFKNKVKSFIVNDFGQEQNGKISDLKVMDLKTESQLSSNMKNNSLRNKRTKNKFMNSPIQQKMHSQFL